MHLQCINCDIKQVNKIKNILSFSFKLETKVTEQVTEYLKTCDMKKAIQKSWEIYGKLSLKKLIMTILIKI